MNYTCWSSFWIIFLWIRKPFFQPHYIIYVYKVLNDNLFSFFLVMTVLSQIKSSTVCIIMYPLIPWLCSSCERLDFALLVKGFVLEFNKFLRSHKSKTNSKVCTNWNVHLQYNIYAIEINWIYPHITPA